MKIYTVLVNYEYEGFNIHSVYLTEAAAINAAIKLSSQIFHLKYHPGPVRHNEDGIHVEEFEVQE